MTDLRVVRGMPTDEELAAVVVVLMRVGGARADSAERAARSPANWTRTAGYRPPSSWAGRGRPESRDRPAPR